MKRDEHGLSFKDLFSHKSTTVVLQGGFTDAKRFAKEDLSVDTRYRPTEEGLNFLEIKNIHDAYEYLKQKYERVKANEEKWEKEQTAEKGFRNTGYEYSMELQRYTAVLADRLEKEGILKKAGTKFLHNLVIFNKLSKTQAKDDRLATQIRSLMTLEVLSTATELAYERQLPINLHETMNEYERDYWTRQPE